MRLYHGSSVYIDTIDVSLSKVGKDFLRILLVS